ncbi:N-acetylmuramoyl-L-alanine amidase [Phycicoccus ginsengisoli]
MAAKAGRVERVGTDPLWLGPGTTTVQVRYRAADRPVAERARLELVDPGTSPADAPATAPPGSAQASAPQPRIIWRSWWGADESLRTCSPSYSPTTLAMVVHHTAGTNSYTASQSAALVRGIYAYHAKSLGWCDIGYNMLVDKYGQVFEGRAGGVDSPVIGAHTGGFNTNTFGVSVLGDYTSTSLPSAGMSALQGVLAWRADGFYIPAKGTSVLTSAGGGSLYPAGQKVTKNTISGHRDLWPTSCPGAWLYGQLGAIRNGVAARQSYTGSAVYRRWVAMGGASGSLGSPSRGERVLPYGSQTPFQGGQALYATPRGAFRMGAGFNSFYWNNAGYAAWGYPLGDEYGIAGGARVDLQSRSMLWSSATGTHGIRGGVRNYWVAVGGSAGTLQFPTGEEYNPNSAGAAQRFQGGSVLWTSTHGAHATLGDVDTAYWANGGPTAYFGYPQADRSTVLTGAFQQFQRGRIYTNPATGTWPVIGAIGSRYITYGGPASPLGFPIAGEAANSTGVVQTFERGSISWNRTTGVTTVNLG